MRMVESCLETSKFGPDEWLLTLFYAGVVLSITGVALIAVRLNEMKASWAAATVGGTGLAAGLGAWVMYGKNFKTLTHEITGRLNFRDRPQLTITDSGGDDLRLQFLDIFSCAAQKRFSNLGNSLLHVKHSKHLEIRNLFVDAGERGVRRCFFSTSIMDPHIKDSVWSWCLPQEDSSTLEDRPIQMERIRYLTHLGVTRSALVPWGSEECVNYIEMGRFKDKGTAGLMRDGRLRDPRGPNGLVQWDAMSRGIQVYIIKNTLIAPPAEGGVRQDKYVLKMKTPGTYMSPESHINAYNAIITYRTIHVGRGRFGVDLPTNLYPSSLEGFRSINENTLFIHAGNSIEITSTGGNYYRMLPQYRDMARELWGILEPPGVQAELDQRDSTQTISPVTDRIRESHPSEEFTMLSNAIKNSIGSLEWGVRVWSIRTTAPTPTARSNDAEISRWLIEVIVMQKISGFPEEVSKALKRIGVNIKPTKFVVNETKKDFIGALRKPHNNDSRRPWAGVILDNEKNAEQLDIILANFDGKFIDRNAPQVQKREFLLTHARAAWPMPGDFVIINGKPPKGTKYDQAQSIQARLDELRANIKARDTDDWNNTLVKLQEEYYTPMLWQTAQRRLSRVTKVDQEKITVEMVFILCLGDGDDQRLYITANLDVDRGMARIMHGQYESLTRAMLEEENARLDRNSRSPMVLGDTNDFSSGGWMSVNIKTTGDKKNTLEGFIKSNFMPTLFSKFDKDSQLFTSSQWEKAHNSQNEDVKRVYENSLANNNDIIQAQADAAVAANQQYDEGERNISVWSRTANCGVPIDRGMLDFKYGQRTGSYRHMVPFGSWTLGAGVGAGAGYLLGASAWPLGGAVALGAAVGRWLSNVTNLPDTVAIGGCTSNMISEFQKTEQERYAERSKQWTWNSLFGGPNIITG